jgi:hypothetical protein
MGSCQPRQRGRAEAGRSTGSRGGLLSAAMVEGSSLCRRDGFEGREVALKEQEIASGVRSMTASDARLAVCNALLTIAIFSYTQKDV